MDTELDEPPLSEDKPPSRRTHLVEQSDSINDLDEHRAAFYLNNLADHQTGSLYRMDTAGIFHLTFKDWRRRCVVGF
jgi:hypothetical protein